MCNLHKDTSPASDYQSFKLREINLKLSIPVAPLRKGAGIESHQSQKRLPPPAPGAQGLMAGVPGLTAGVSGLAAGWSH